jgi:penicillin amidase
MKKLLKVLKVAGLVVAALLVAAALLGAWLVRRAWPQEDGSLGVAGLHAQVEVVRVEPGVPHLYARDGHDLFFAQGYVHAQDRLWQMELNRRLGAGEVSALFGEAALDLDRTMRVFEIRAGAERDWQASSPPVRAMLLAYCDGVNAFLAQHRGRLPLEFILLGVEPRPWTPVDSLSWAKLMALNLALNSSFEILRSQLTERLGAAAAARLLLPYPPGEPVIVPPPPGGYAAPAPPPATLAAAVKPGKGKRAAGLGLAPLVPAAPLPAAPAAGTLSAAGGRRRPGAPAAGGGALAGGRQALTGGRQAAWGSNAWVVAGSRTATGRPLLANDTHLGLQMPSVWYQIGLHGGGWDVVGFSFPGMPLVVIGHNPRIAWGITNLCADVTDLYVEKLDAPLAGHPRRYRFRGAWRDLAVTRQRIQIKGKPALDYEVRATHHGPIVNDAFPELKNAPPTAVRWTALEPGGARLLDALMALDRAAGWATFHQALGSWDVPSLDFVYADVDGHIGYQATGLIPLRAPGQQGLVPANGWEGAAEWRGFIPYDALPRLYDPPQGFIVSANNKVAGDGYPFFLAYDMADPYRARRVTDRLAAARGLAVADMRALQADTYGLPALALRPFLLAVAPAGERERRALDEVRRWDLRYEPDSVGATVFEAWYWHFLGDLLEDKLGKPLLDDYRQVGLSQVPSIVALLGHPADPLFDDRRTPAVEHRDDVVRRALSHAVSWLAKRYGDDPAGWRYGRVHSVTLVHQPLGQSGIAPLMWAFNSATYPAPGTAFTVDAAMPDFTNPFAVVFGTSQRMIVDLADLDRSLWVNSTGECAVPFHRHREDQTKRWIDVDYYPLLASEAKLRAAAEARLLLVPDSGGRPSPSPDGTAPAAQAPAYSSPPWPFSRWLFTAFPASTRPLLNTSCGVSSWAVAASTCLTCPGLVSPSSRTLSIRAATPATIGEAKLVPAPMR